MKNSLSSFDVTAIVADLQVAVGGFLDKVYQPEHGHLVFSVRTPGKGRTFIHFVTGKWLYASKKAGDMPPNPSSFAMLLRKHLSNSRIVGGSQQGFDRIVVLSFEKGEKHDLVLEIFAKGNAVLVKEGVIVQPLTTRTWKHRDVRARKAFSFPPPIPDPLTLSSEDFEAVFRDSDSDVVRTIATKLNLGGKYSEEMCVRSGLDKNRLSKEVTPEELATLVGVIREFAGEVRASRCGYVISDAENPVDVAPSKLSIYKDLAYEELPSFSEAVESYVMRSPAPSRSVVEQSGDDELERLQRKLVQQEQASLSLQRESLEAKKIGDSLFANYADIANVLLTAKDMLSQSNSLTDFPGFVSFDKRRSLLAVSMPSGTCELDIKGTVESNAQRYYESGKKKKAKLEGVLPALEETRAAIANRKKGLASKEAEKTARKKPTKRFWFERYRWFISSEGAVVLGGKDARTNDMLVKKHLEAGDRYAHADIHGAPSVVVKMKDGIGEPTLSEAREFAAATSKAWNAKIGSAVGYWVLPGQVSKTPQSGEYLARGAFVIRGKRNYSEKMEIRLGIGEIEFEGERKVMCGPESAVKTWSTRYVIIKPGRVEKNRAAKRLAEEFDVPIEEIQSILPPGDIDIVEQIDIDIRLS